MTKRTEKRIEPQRLPEVRRITCTMKQLVECIPAFREVMGIKMSAQRSYHIAKLSRIINEELAHFQTQRDALIKELGEPATLTSEEEKAGMAPYNRVTIANMKTYLERYGELESVSVVLEWGPIPMAWLADQQITPDTMFGLEPFLALGPVPM